MWNPYITSSKKVKELIADFGNPDIIQVRRIFTSVTDSRIWKNKVQRRLKVISSPKWINDSYGFGPKNLNNLISAKSVSTGNSGLVTKEEFVSNPDLVGVMKGRKNPKLSEHRKGNSITKGYTNEYRLENNMKPITGRPKGVKSSDQGRLNRSLATKGKARVKNIETDKIFYTEKNNPEIGLSLILYPTNKKRI